MAFPKKKSRVVNLDGKRYRYRFIATRLFVMEDVDEAGNVLCIDTDKVNLSAYGPADIIYVIKQAMIQGWEPAKKGPAFIPPNTIDVPVK